MLKYKCNKCGSKKYLHLHHITYKPLRLVYLCKHCHSLITFINTYYRLGINGIVPGRMKLWRIFKKDNIFEYDEKMIVDYYNNKLRKYNKYDIPEGLRYIPLNNASYMIKNNNANKMISGDYLTTEYKQLSFN